MSDVLKSNTTALRSCILFEVLQRTPIKEVYSKFSRTLGNDFMEYREFDFWYYRFLNGEHDLNFERDKDEKIYELMDMPIDVMENIVKYLNFVDRANLVQTSRSLQTFVEDQKLFYHTLRLNVSNHILVSFGDAVNIHYIQRYLGPRCTPEHELQCFKKIIKNPKLYLDTLEIKFDVPSHLNHFPSLENASKDLEDALNLTHYLKVKKLVLKEYSKDKLSDILPTLKPGYLTTIRIYSLNRNVDLMKQVFEMEQWKQAKLFHSDGDEFIWPLHHLYHFEEFAVSLLEFSVEDIRQMKEILFKSSNFKRGFLTIHFDIDMFILDQEFGNALRENPHVYHYPIPNSTDHFEIKFDGWTLEIQRQKS